MASAGVLDHPRMWAKEPRVERSDDLLEDRIVGEDTFDAATGCVDFLLTNPVGVNLFGYFNVHSMRATADVINDMISGDAASRDSETGFDLGGQDHPVILAA